MARHEFELYSKEVEIETKSGKKVYKLLPLSGRFMPKLMGVATKLSQADKNKAETALDEDVIAKLHDLIKETLRVSMNVEDKDLEQLDRFVSQNLFSFVEPLIDVNLGNSLKEN